MTEKVVSLRELVNPTPRQDQFLEAVKTHLFTLYGGAGGGGKSYILRWTLLALLLKWGKEGHYGVRAGLFSIDYPTLNDRQLSKIRAEFPDWMGTFHEQAREFRLAPRFGGGVLCFRNLDDPSKYKSAEFAAIAVEELTEITRQDFDDIRWRRRWPGIDRCPFLGATNPTGIGLYWVKKLWVDRDFTDEPEALDPEEFAYVPAKASDNPHLSPQYLKELASLPDGMRQALLDGSWDVFAGQAFTEWRRDIHVVEPFKIPSWWRRWRSNDRGYGEPATWYWFAASPDGQVFVYREYVCTHVAPSKQAANVVEASVLGNEVPGGMPEIDPETNEPMREKIDFTAVPDDVNSSDPEKGKSWADLYREGGISGLMVVRRDPDLRAALMHEYLEPYDHPTDEDRQTAKLQVFSTCTYLIRTLPTLPTDPLHPNRVKSGGEDHGFDGAGHGLQAWHAEESKEPQAPKNRLQTHKDKLARAIKASRRGAY